MSLKLRWSENYLKLYIEGWAMRAGRINVAGNLDYENLDNDNLDHDNLENESL